MSNSPPPLESPRLPRRPWLARLYSGLGLLALLGAGAWWWSGSEGSLATGLRLTDALLPAGQSLQASGVEGSLRHGGRIASLQWQQDGLSLKAQGLALQIDAGRLLQGQLPLHTLHLDRLEGQSQNAAQSSSPVTQLIWPLQVQLSWRIGTLHWQGAAPFDATALQGDYRFDGQHHALLLDRLQWAQGQYRARIELQARTPMALDAQLQGELAWPSQHTAHQPLQAFAQLKGALGGVHAELALTARLSTPDKRPDAPQLELQGQWHPQAAQPITALQARLQQIDLSMLWPSAPQTGLNGDVQAHADGSLWRLDVALTNRVTGPLDQGRIPLQQLQARLLHDATGWQVPTFQARWPGGGVRGQGQWQASAWQGQWQIDRLQAVQWWSSLPGPALTGQITAIQHESGALALQARLQPQDSPPAPAGSGTAAGLRLEARWQDGSWTLPQFQLDWADAHVQGEGRWTPAQALLQASAQWQLPGLRAGLKGQLSPRQGSGQWQIESQDTQRLWAWLSRWPGLRERLQGWRRPDALLADGQWQGGWAASGLVLQARMATPEVQAQARTALRQDGASGNWRGQIEQLQLQWQGLRGDPAPGQMDLQNPLPWLWHPQDRRLQWQAHRWLLQGPGGRAPVVVDAGDWQMTRHHGAWPAVRAQAQVSDLPLRWAAWLGLPPTPGDLLLQGGLDLALQERPRLRAWLERSRGDLQVGTEQPNPSPVQAGIRTAHVQLQVDGPLATLNLNWDSAQAGQLQAQLQSRLDPGSHTGLAGLWPATAPLSGQVNARLPRVGTWSWLAPPGWRVQGSLDTRLDVSGTRAQPQWTGTLQADHLAVRSAIEGIEFRQGRLRARLQEQQVLLDELRLLGAGDQGGELLAQGQVRWLPQAGPLLQAVQMDVQMQAKGLRVTHRADRRLSLSGQVHAQLDRGHMQLRGQLQADSALFILPDDSTPTLGKDVVIAQARTAATPAAPPEGLSVMGTPDIQVLLNLGPDFQLRGQGVTSRLAGEVQLSSSAATGGQPRLVGQVRTEGGRYQAYGQQLDIEQGLLRFAGPYDNPALDILALRPNLSQRVGVRVSGTALAPRIRLYADPDMPDADKLAWLVLGRSPAAGGAESAVLQQAALSLLGGNGKSLGGELASALGFDEVSLASRSATTPTGTTATGTAVTLGKRLSKDFYLAYESSVSGTFGSLFIFYDLSRKLTLRAQTGEINALDLVYTIRHD